MMINKAAGGSLLLFFWQMTMASTKNSPVHRRSDLLSSGCAASQVHTYSLTGSMIAAFRACSLS